MPNKNLFRSYCAKAGLSQAAVAARAKMSENTLSAKVCGHVPFNTRDINVLCKILNITNLADKAAIFLE